MIRFFASQPHYVNHLRPYRDAIIGTGDVPQVWEPPQILPDDGMPVVIAGMQDAKLVPADCPLALVEHGTGQAYKDLDHGAYAGGRDRKRVSLFLCPSERVAALNLARYPSAQAVVTGPAHLDEWFGDHCGLRNAHDDGPSVVAFAWHWDARIHPEIRTAWPHYVDPVRRYVESTSHHVLGHAHPRFWETMQPAYEALGVEVVHTPDAVFHRADLLVVDNSSVMYEAAALGIPILALDAPWYRDQPRHGLRFYDQVPGLRLRSYRDQAPDAGITYAHHGRDHLADAIDEALEDRPELQALRASVTAHVYQGLDGHAAERGADALGEWVQRVGPRSY